MGNKKETTPPLLAIVGPTATGKTAVGIDVAIRLSGEIISIDSMQVYKWMDIGTAKPTLEEMKGIPHHMMGIQDPREPMNVKTYKECADKAIQGIYNRGNIPILLGGTGLYLKAIIDDFLFPDMGKDEELRETLHDEALSKGTQQLHNRLAKVDPKAAENIHPNDVKRIIRALEVYITTGKPITEHQKGFYEHTSPYCLCVVGLIMPRKELYDRINKRVDKMIEIGLVGEVENLISKGCSLEDPSMQGLGYKEIVQYLKGEYTLEEAIKILKRNTRRYAKRQITWFKRDERIEWIERAEGQSNEELVQKIIDLKEGKFNFMMNNN